MTQLDRLWNGQPAPPDARGRIEAALGADVLTLSWDLACPAPPQIPAGPAGFHEGLWEHDVVELFLAPASVPDPPHYLEFEVGPGGHWLALAFDDVRQRSAELRDLRLEADHVRGPASWTGHASVSRRAIEAVIGPPPWRGLIAAVLSAGPGAPRVHLTAPALPGPRPDFHQPVAWRAGWPA